MIKVTAIPFTGYPVTDMSRARGFYEGVLGLKSGSIWHHEDRAWVEYDVGPATLAISNMAADQWKPSSDGPAIALEVENFDDAAAARRQVRRRAHGISHVPARGRL